MEASVLPCCAKCGADESHFTSKENTQHTHSGFLIYCGKCGAALTWVYQHSSFASTG